MVSEFNILKLKTDSSFFFNNNFSVIPGADAGADAGLTVEEKDGNCPYSYHHEHSDAGFTFDYLCHNINQKSVTYNCQRKRCSKIANV